MRSSPLTVLVLGSSLVTGCASQFEPTSSPMAIMSPSGAHHSGAPSGDTGCSQGFEDADGDGFGGTTVAGPCEPGVPNSDDCDDSDPRLHPGANEECDGHDDDCDGIIDEDGVCCGDPLVPERFEGVSIVDDVAVTWVGDPLLSAGELLPWGDQNGNCLDEIWVNDRRYAILFETPLRSWTEHARIDLGGDPTATLVPAGDVDRDGALDLWVAQPYESPNGYQSGRTSLLLGPFSGVRTLDQAHCVIEGDTEMESLGLSAAGGQDLTGDGVPDLVVSVPLDGPGTYAYVFSGATCVGVRTKVDAAGTFSNDAWIFAYFQPPVDVDGDGAVDLVHGGNDVSHSGVWWFRGPFLGERGLASADAVYRGEGTYPNEAEVWPSLVEDLDGDGVVDLLIHGGIAYPDLAYEAWLAPGPLLVGEHFVSEIATTRLVGGVSGMSFASGDLDLDGEVDLLVGQPDLLDGRRSGVGTAAVTYGPLVGEIDLRGAPAFTGEHEWAYTGYHVAAPGDLDGDGVPDLVVDSWLDAEIHALFGPSAP